MSSYEQDGNIGVLTLRGNLTKRRLNKLKTVLIAAIGNADHLFLNLARVSHIDASCARLFSVAERNARVLGKRLALIGTADKPFRQALEAGSRG